MTSTAPRRTIVSDYLLEDDQPHCVGVYSSHTFRMVESRLRRRYPGEDAFGLAQVQADRTGEIQHQRAVYIDMVHHRKSGGSNEVSHPLCRRSFNRPDVCSGLACRDPDRCGTATATKPPRLISSSTTFPRRRKTTRPPPPSSRSWTAGATPTAATSRRSATARSPPTKTNPRRISSSAPAPRAAGS